MKTTRRILVDPNKARDINYNSFREGFKKYMEKAREELEDFKTPDWDKGYESFII